MFIEEMQGGLGCTEIPIRAQWPIHFSHVAILLAQIKMDTNQAVKFKRSKKCGHLITDNGGDIKIGERMKEHDAHSGHPLRTSFLLVIV